MNPPPLPNPGKQHSLARKIALGSIIAPLLTILVAAAFYAARQAGEPLRAVKLFCGGICVLLILTGFVLAIVALCSIPRHGRRGILGRGMTGLILNGVLVLFLVGVFMSGVMKGIKQKSTGRQAVRDLQAASEDAKQRLRESYDPEQGITNMDAGNIERLASELESAAGKLSGDEALIMQAMADYLTGLQKQSEKYQVAVTEFSDAEVLNLGTLTAKSQIETRRQIVRRWLDVNSELKTAVVQSEVTIRARLVELKIPPTQIEEVIKGFNSKAAPRRALIVRIRDCDQKIGEAALGALDLLETQWGHWTYSNLSEVVTFSADQHNELYSSLIAEITAAGEEQVKLQGRLVKLR